MGDAERLRVIAHQCEEFLQMIAEGTYNAAPEHMTADLVYLRDLARSADA